jgi:uncharacterized delta-60 repeat protein
MASKKSMRISAIKRAGMWGATLTLAAFANHADAEWTSNTTFAADQPVHSVTLQADGKIIIGGDFTMVQGAPRGHVARLNADGTIDFTFMNGLAGANLSVLSTAVQPDDKILIGGQFSTVNGVPHAGLARLLTNGAVDMTFNARTGSAPFLVQSDGKLVAATAIQTLTGTSDNLFRLSADGSKDTNWTTTIFGGTVNAMTSQPDGKLVITGTFAEVNGLIRAGLARLNTNGATDTNFQNGMKGAPGIVASVALQSDGRLVIGGYFFSVNGISRVRLARLNTDGSLDTTFQNGTAGADGEVEAIVLQPDGKILVGGSFKTINTSRRGGIARLNADGSVDGTFQNGMAGADGIVEALALQPDGKVVMGGTFTNVNGQPRSYVARLNADGSLDFTFQNGAAPAPILASPAIVSNHFGFLIDGASN